MTSPNAFGRPVVVTGASGFVGRNLAPHLESLGHRVIRISLRDSRWRERIPEETFAVIHLAGLAHDLKRTSASEDYFDVNVGLTREILGAFLASGAEKFVFLSSVKAVADAPGEEIVTEERSPDPATSYGRSKLAAERLILSAAAGRKGVYVLRPCMIHGPGNRGNLNLLYRWIVSGIPYPLGAFENARSFLSVENLDFVIGQFLAGDCPSGVYNVADGEALSTREVVRLIAESRNRKPRSWRWPVPCIHALARLADALRLPFGRDRLAKLTESYRVDNRKLLAVLGEELPLTAREGLCRTLESFAKART